MRSAVLQQLLDRQKHVKFGDFVLSNDWPQLHHSLTSGSSKIEDILPPLLQSNKLFAFIEYLFTLDPTSLHLRCLSSLLPHLPDSDFPRLIPLFRTLLLSHAQHQTAIISLIVRSVFSTDSPVFGDSLISILEASPALHSVISGSITKFFPQTSFPSDQQLRFLRASLSICSRSSEIMVAVMPRIFQHLVALDCEFLLEVAPDGSYVVDDDVALSFAPQLRLFFEFLTSLGADVSGLLLPLFNVYLIELPRIAIVQFIFFYVSSLHRDTADNFVGYLLAKLFDAQASQRARSNAALYLESFIARAGFVDEEFAAAILDYVADFAFRYAKHVQLENPDEFKLDIEGHSCFYYAVQCVVYVICWRWREWKRADWKAVTRWHLQELFGNELRAADVIDRNTVELFRELKLFEAIPESPILARIPVWFPFDPCPLEEIGMLIREAYVVWEQCEPDDIDRLLDRELIKICQTRLISIQPIDVE